MAVRKALVLITGEIKELPSGDTLSGAASAFKGILRVLKPLAPATSYATLDTRPGGSTPAENLEVFDFDATSVEYMDFLCQLNGYGGGGLTFVIPWTATSATSGTVKWDIAIRRLTGGGDDVDTSKTYDYNTANGTADATNGKLTYTTITFTDGADMDSWADGELAILRVKRDTSVSGNMTGDAELWYPRGRET